MSYGIYTKDKDPVTSLYPPVYNTIHPDLQRAAAGLVSQYGPNNVPKGHFESVVQWMYNVHADEMVKQMYVSRTINEYPTVEPFIKEFLRLALVQKLLDLRAYYFSYC